MEVKCKQCGRTFETNDKRRKFCNENCRRLWYNNWRKQYSTVLRGKYTREDKDNINRKHREIRERKKYETYERIAKEIMSIKDPSKLAKYLMTTFKGVRKERS